MEQGSLSHSALSETSQSHTTMPEPKKDVRLAWCREGQCLRRSGLTRRRWQQQGVSMGLLQLGSLRVLGS